MLKFQTQVGNILYEDVSLGETAKFDWDDSELEFLKTPLTTPLCKKIVKDVCDDYKLPIIQIRKVNKIDPKFGGWCRQSESGNYYIELYKDTFNVNFLIHELTHYVRLSLGKEKISNNVEETMIHGKKFWQNFAYILKLSMKEFDS